MKRLSPSPSLDAFMSISQPKEEKSSKKHQIYTKEFQAMLDGLDEEDSLEEGGQATEKKRCLSMHQVKALEKNFDVGNKLEPKRKVKLAEELGLQPRQVAIWFQNRRARWKTKVLEKDYAMLKANYDALKLDHDNLEKEKLGLITMVSLLNDKSLIKQSKKKTKTTVISETGQNQQCSTNDPTKTTNNSLTTHAVQKTKYWHFTSIPNTKTTTSNSLLFTEKYENLQDQTLLICIFLFTLHYPISCIKPFYN
ncbi:hypothetical protein V6Z12_D13G065500 [Gossypium hirsutum]